LYDKQQDIKSNRHFPCVEYYDVWHDISGGNWSPVSMFLILLHVALLLKSVIQCFSCCFEEAWNVKSLQTTDDRQRTPSDSNSSPGPRWTKNNYRHHKYQHWHTSIALLLF
jgi:hypothetical protein